MRRLIRDREDFMARVKALKIKTSGVPRGLSISDAAEMTIHEYAHAAILGLGVLSHKEIGDAVGIALVGNRAARANELDTLAAECLLLQEIDPVFEQDLFLKGQEYSTDIRRCSLKVLYRLKGKRLQVTRRHAKATIRSIEKAAARYGSIG